MTEQTKLQMQDVLNTVELNPNVRKSITYAKARAVIEQYFPTRRDRRTAKMVVVEFLKGVLDHTQPKGRPSKDEFGNTLTHVSVRFPDGSVARF